MKKLSIIVISATALLAACGGSASTTPSSTTPTSTTSTTSIATSTTSTTVPTSGTISDLLAFLDSRGVPCSDFVQDDDTLDTYDPAGYGKGITSGTCKLDGKIKVQLFTYANSGQKVLLSLIASIACAFESKGARYDWVDGGLWSIDFEDEKSTPKNGFQTIAETLALKTKAKSWFAVCGQPTLQGTNPEQTP